MTSCISISLKQVVRTWRIFEFIETWQWPLELCGWRSFLICRDFAKKFGTQDSWDGIFLEEVCTCVPSHLWCSVSKYLKLKRNTYLSSYLFLNFKCQCLKRISKTLSQGTKKKNNKWWLFSIFEGCQIKIRSS